MKNWMLLIVCSMFLGAAVQAADKVDESKMDEKEKTRRRMLRAAGIDPDKRDAEIAAKKAAAAAGKSTSTAPTATTAPGVPNEYTFNVSGMM
jgi:hypothetical protein